jgi:hypothetical protein
MKTVNKFCFWFNLLAAAFDLAVFLMYGWYSALFFGLYSAGLAILIDRNTAKEKEVKS